MEKPVCKDCQHFIQHYGNKDGRFFQLNCGHCKIRKKRQNRPSDHICKLFSPGIPDLMEPVTKEYLTKDILDYILRLDLLSDLLEEIKVVGDG